MDHGLWLPWPGLWLPWPVALTQRRDEAERRPQVQVEEGPGEEGAELLEGAQLVRLRPALEGGTELVQSLPAERLQRGGYKVAREERSWSRACQPSGAAGWSEGGRSGQKAVVG